MALIVEDGTGLADAESYNSIAEISAYNDLHDAVPAWDSADQDEQERSARRAFQYMNARYLQRVKGARLVATQSGLFPRFGVEVDGVYLEPAPLPCGWLDAHCELSIKGVSETLMPDVANPGTIASELKTLGPLSKSVSYLGGKSQIKWYRLADKLVAGLVNGTDYAERA